MHRQTEDRCIASIDIGGTTTKVGVVSSSGLRSGQTREFPTPATGDPDSFLSMMIRELEQIQSERVQISGIGIAVPGVLSMDGEVVEHCPNTPVLVGYPFRTALKQWFGMPATLEVDCNAAALGEHAFGAGRDVKRLLVISLGTGAGACIAHQWGASALYRRMLWRSGTRICRRGAPVLGRMQRMLRI